MIHASSQDTKRVVTQGCPWLVRLLVIGAIFLVKGEVSLAGKTDTRPNVVFILADDLGWSDTTLYGTTRFYETPNIERLARRGMLFSNAYTAHPLCSPTRCSIMTGLDPARTGFTSAAGHVLNVVLEKKLPSRARSDQKVLTPRSVSRLDPKYTTLAETSKAAGYVTGNATSICATSSLRMSPVSTSSPCTRSAPKTSLRSVKATVESTPPETSMKTLRSPTSVRI